MRTAIFLGLALIANAISKEVIIPDSDVSWFIGWITMIMMAMDVVDFLTKNLKKKK